MIDTTPGRMKIAALLPQHPAIGHRLVEKSLTKKEIANLIDAVYRHCGQKATVIFADQIMGLGFREAAKAGISFGKDDIVIPERKAEIVETTRTLVEEYEQQYADGLITKGEKYNKVVDAWDKATDRVADEMMAEISTKKLDENGRETEINSIWMMANSGARGSQAQMKQLGGMRGLMAKPSGEIIETPIISNFKEGLTVQEYFNSTHGARKGLADTALKTANSGYLTRRLVDVAQDCIIVEEDCGTTRGITLRAVVEGGDVLVSLGQRILGRFTAEDVKEPGTNELVVPADTYLDENQIEAVEAAGVQQVKVRSVLTCEAKVGVCGACYGRDLARGTPVNIGEAVGVIAAQSIGEPGTQLTMRTFHIGGTAQVAEQSFYEAANDGVARFVGGATVQTPEGDLIVMSRNMQLVVQVDGKDREAYRPPYGARLRVKDGQDVKRGVRLAEWDPYTTPIITEVGGKVRFEDLVEGVSFREEADEATGIVNRVVIDWRASTKGGDLRPDHGGARRGRQLQAAGQRRRGPLPAAGGRDPLRRRRRRGQARRRAGPPSHRERQDAGHHRRSAAGGGAVRGAPAEGLRGDRRDGRPGRVRARLQEQAPDQDHPGKRRRRAHRGGRVPDPEGQAHRRPRRRRDPQGRVPDRRQPRSARHPADPGHRGAGRLPGQRDPGGLPAAGRADQRQAHRGDRSPDAAEGRDPGARATPAC